METGEHLIKCGTRRGFRTSLGRGDPCTRYQIAKLREARYFVFFTFKLGAGVTPAARRAGDYSVALSGTCSQCARSSSRSAASMRGF